MNELDYKKRIKQLEKYERAHISMCQENDKLRRTLRGIVESSNPVYRFANTSFPSSFNVGYDDIQEAKRLLGKEQQNEE